MSSEMQEQPKLAGVCTNPYGEGCWWPADSTDDKCPEIDCDCKPWFYVPAPVSEEAPDAA